MEARLVLDDVQEQSERPMEEPDAEATPDADLVPVGQSRTRDLQRAAEFVSYAQTFEDALLWRALGRFGPGFYIDVGAGEPEADSVTKAFYDAGWRGINIEPMTGPWERLRAARPRDINLNVAVEDEPAGSKTYFSVDSDNGLSTGLGHLARTYQDDGREVQEVEVRVMTLAEIWDAFVDREVHFLKVDVEGAEGLVLAGADFARNRPWVVLAESELTDSDPESLDWDGLLRSNAYDFVFHDGLNRYYVAREKATVIGSAFDVPVNWLDNAVPVREKHAHRLVRQQAEELESTRKALERVEGEARSLAEQLDAIRRERDSMVAELQGLRGRIEVVTVELDACRQELYEDSRHIAWLSAERAKLIWDVDACRARIRTLEDQEEHRAGQVDDLINRVHHKETEIRDLHASTSWRLTRPMRKASDLVRRARRRSGDA